MSPTEAASHIAEVLKQNGFAGFIVVIAPSEVAFKYQFEAPWSCARLDDTPEGAVVRMKAKACDFPSKEAQQKCVEDTIGMVLGMMNQLERSMLDLEALTAMIASQVGEIIHREERNG